MKMRRWAPALALVMLVAAAVMVAGPAVARTAPKVPSTVTITTGEGAKFTGRVSAAKKKCRAGRTVKLYREAGSSRGEDLLVGTAKTDASGRWTLNGSFLAGVYFAQVLPLTAHLEDESIRCLGDLGVRMHY